MNILFTLVEVADYLRVDQFAIRTLIRRKQIPAFKVGGVWRFQKEVIDTWSIKENVDIQRASASKKASRYSMSSRIDGAPLRRSGQNIDDRVTTERNCTVTCLYSSGFEDSVEVDAANMYEALSQALLIVGKRMVRVS